MFVLSRPADYISNLSSLSQNWTRKQLLALANLYCQIWSGFLWQPQCCTQCRLKRSHFLWGYFNMRLFSSSQLGGLKFFNKAFLRHCDFKRFRALLDLSSAKWASTYLPLPERKSSAQSWQRFLKFLSAATYNDIIHMYPHNTNKPLFSLDLVPQHVDTWI